MSMTEPKKARAERMRRRNLGLPAPPRKQPTYTSPHVIRSILTPLINRARTTHCFEAEHWISPECRAAARSKTRIRRADEPIQPMACRIIYPEPGSPEALRRAEEDANRVKPNPAERMATKQPRRPFRPFKGSF